jgi:hypothetical protein
LYPPLPSLDEMHCIRDHLFNNESDIANYLKRDRMLELIDKFGCISRTIFDFGNREIDLDDIEKKLENATAVERLLEMIGSSVVDHDVASGRFVHVVPYHRLSAAEDKDEDEPDELNEYACSDDQRGAIARARSKGKRTAEEADLSVIGLSPDERIKFLRASYTTVVTHGRQTISVIRPSNIHFVICRRMMTLILMAQRTELAGFRGLLFEPFVHKLFNETGVVGRLKNLETGNELGTKKLGPWKKKIVYNDHSELVSTANVYNMPHKGNTASIDSLVHSEGLCFQVTTSENHGINLPGFVNLMDTHLR